MVPWVKDPSLSQQQLGLMGWYGFDPCPWVPQPSTPSSGKEKKKKKKTTKQKHMHKKNPTQNTVQSLTTMKTKVPQLRRFGHHSLRIFFPK